MRNLESILKRIDGRGYKSYKQIEGRYEFPSYELFIDHVQADPFAPPSAVRVRMPQRVAGLPRELFKNKSRKTALEDYLTRDFRKNARMYSGRKGTGKSGMITITEPSQQVLERTAMEVNGEFIEARFFMGLPARGRRVLCRAAHQMFFEELPSIVESSLIYGNLDPKAAEEHVKAAEDAAYIRDNLKEKGLIAFVANDSMLPRRSGVDERPLTDGVPFGSPPSLEVTFQCPNRVVRGMGIPEGVTLIVGGGYHGKSTLLNALALGVYNHIPGDGREFVITAEDAVKIRSEDGRYVEGVDISSFISDLPDERDTSHFSTENASGSTSQATNMMEALEMGSRLLLIDEDTSATNLMIRDRRMQELVAKDKEPITPLIDMIRPLKKLGVSIVLIMGGLGDYFDVGDTVIMMDSYRPRDASKEAKDIAAKYTARRKSEEPGKITIRDRFPDARSIDARRRGKVKIKARGIHGLSFGEETIDLSRVEQLVETAQVRSIGELIHHVSKLPARKSLHEVLDELEKGLEKDGLTSLLLVRGNYVRPRKYEVAAAINRLRSLRCS
ncbi:MAG: ABC-ATPase domain-containing protein [Candidatus Hadarchaeota archaeon]|nr:ABC-ATPase domain-containing protein [Candidatus Hadarchaeota archaeon]